MAKLAGCDPKLKSTEAGGLQPNTYLKNPDFQEKSYRVTAHQAFTHAAATPLAFRALKPTGATEKSWGGTLAPKLVPGVSEGTG